ncbi:ATP-binding protein [Caulobacter sp. RHG1]|uniref:sensor histidine kinase n=1 Tax=Caulobacter sp. (strain RHG1) TaxID=2545762 RepID=UPI0015520F6F|nr:ATP-binding protein [Caulobacter sp. RHG1]NQE61356.1 Signal transduction histidine kinase regulating C4-dicarboxylate transport system [Caulobacter sp. RHG1]
MTSSRLPNLRDPAVRQWAAFLIVGLVLLAGLVGFAGAIAERRATADLSRQAQASATLHAAVLRSELAKHRSLPFVLAQDPDVAQLLRSNDQRGVEAMNRKLETLSGGTRAAVIYLLNAKGMAVAASNWREPTSFVGSDYSFRPYFKEAQADGTAELFALGTVSRRPGLFMSKRIDGPEGVLGVVVVKVEFDALEAEWSAAEPAFAADARGVIMVTSIPAWRFSTLTPLPRAEQTRLHAEHRFGDAPFAVLKMSPPPRAGRAPTLTSVSPPDQEESRFIAASAELGAVDWTVYTLTPVGAPLRTAVAGARAIALLIGLVACAIAAALLRWRGQSSIRAARQEAARQELETRVQERTAELRKSNKRLTVEMEERRRAEAHVHRMQDELIQSNKLATLGQIAAGVAHEINQPVAAIRAYADNAAVFLERADDKTAKANLGLIAGLTDRIGLITDELRAFARKSSAPPAPVVVREAIDGALLLIGPRLRQQGVSVIRNEADEAAKAMAERFRLEQVLVNLLQNAVEAMDGRPDPEILIQVSVKRSQVRILVVDNGPGVAPEAAQTLFTPFATTKPRGLGLGLVISRDIVAEFGGELSLEPGPGGARFLLTLSKARS